MSISHCCVFTTLNFKTEARPEARPQEIVITRHGKPAGVLIGCESEDDWFDYRLEHDPRFLQRVEQARNGVRAGRGVKLKDIDTE